MGRALVKSMLDYQLSASLTLRCLRLRLASNGAASILPCGPTLRKPQGALLSDTGSHLRSVRRPTAFDLVAAFASMARETAKQRQETIDLCH